MNKDARATPVRATSAGAPAWIFGYGSLIWRPDFPFIAQRPALLRGWRRRFWQASPDHRGVPDAPGRVVTLVEEAGAHCWGMAFLTAATEREAILAALDIREQNGYEREEVMVALEGKDTVSALTYIAGPANPSFVGPAPLQDMATQIARSHGPSGANRDYLRELAANLSRLDIEDEEIMNLSRAVEALRA